MKEELFSLESLERLRSPEKLDTLLVVTKPAAWMALLAMAVLAAAIVVWGLFGVMSTTVGGVGIIMDSGGLMDVIHDSGGYLAEFLVKPGMRVKKGQVIALLSLPSIDNEIMISQDKINISKNQHEMMNSLAAFDALVTRRDIMRKIISPCDGLVLDRDVNPGDYVTAGRTSVCTIRRDYRQGDIRATMYVPFADGKKIQPGMMVQMTPSEGDAKRSGYLLGVVRSVSLYPVVLADIVKLLGNPDLAAWLLARVGGAALEIRVDLIRDSQGPGYLWTSTVGERPIPSPGSFVNGTVVVNRQTPIRRLILRFDKWLRNI